MSGTILGDFLFKLRDSRGLSLREVEEATENKISNAYLSQLENGKIKKPSPNILYSLAEIYGVAWDSLMEKAGYIVSTNSGSSNSEAVTSPLNALGLLSKEEENELLEYLAFIRQKKANHKK